jgi:hypothetical protein
MRFISLLLAGIAFAQGPIGRGVIPVASGGGGGTPGFAAPHTGGNGASSSGTGADIPVTVASVQAGDLVVITLKWEGGDSTAAISDGSSTFVDALVGNHASDTGADPWATTLYCLSSVASGSVTYTPTWGTARGWREIVVGVFHPNSAATITLDGTPAKNGGSSGSLTSGNITTTGTDGIAFGTYGDYGSTLSSVLINGGSVTGSISGGLANKTRIDYKTYASGFTGQYAATVTPSDHWATTITAFKR